MATLRACMAGAGTRSLHRRGCAPLLRFVDFRPFLLSRSTRKRVGKKHTKCSRRARSFARARAHTHTLFLSLFLSHHYGPRCRRTRRCSRTTRRNATTSFSFRLHPLARLEHTMPRLECTLNARQSNDMLLFQALRFRRLACAPDQPPFTRLASPPPFPSPTSLSLALLQHTDNERVCVCVCTLRQTTKTRESHTRMRLLALRSVTYTHPCASNGTIQAD